MKKGLVLLLLVALLLNSVFAGGSSESQVAASGKAEPISYITPGTVAESVPANAKTSKDTLVLRLAADPGSLSPIGTNSYTLETLSLISMPLLWPVDKIGNGGSLSWEITDKALLESATWSDDNLTLHLAIKKGVKFSDGSEVKAEDVKFSFEVIYAKYTDAPFIKDIVVTGDYTLDINLKSINLSFLTGLGLHYTFSKKAYEACKDPEAEFLTSNKLVSCGPYKLVDWVSGDHINLSANPYYVNGEPRIKNIVIRFISEKSVATMELETGGVDVVEEPLWDDFKNTMNGGYGKDILGWQCGGLYLTTVGFNATSMFKDYNVRKAFCLALDKKVIFDGAWDGYGLNAYTVLATSYDGIKSYEDNWPLKRDVEQAKKLLAEAGYPNGFTCRVIYNGDSNQGLALQIMKNQLAEAGINLVINAFDAATYKSMMENETDTWELWVRKWGQTGNPGVLVSGTYSKIMHFKDAKGGQEVIDFFSKLAASTSTESYNKDFGDFQDRFWSDYLFWYPLQMQSYTTLYNGHLHGASRIYVFFDFDNAYFD